MALVTRTIVIVIQDSGARRWRGISTRNDDDYDVYTDKWSIATGDGTGWYFSLIHWIGTPLFSVDNGRYWCSAAHV